MLLCFPAQAHRSKDDRVVLRMAIYSMCKPVLLDMFADAGPTTVKLVNSNTIVITNEHCDDKEVKTVLAETIEPVKDKLRANGMSIECVSL